MKSVAIVGRGDTSRHLYEALATDPEWEAWQLAWDMEPFENTARYFEIHSPDTWENETVSEALRTSPEPKIIQKKKTHPISGLMQYQRWLEYLSKNWGKVVLQDTYFEGAVKYPLEDVMKMPGMETGYLESSITYMLAMAKLEGVKRVGIWGVDLTHEEEYAYQRPNLAYMMGLFRGQGMKIIVPSVSALAEFSKLDDAPTPDFETSDMRRADLEYLLGREVARTGKIPDKMRPDLMKSIYDGQKHPRYGYADLPPDWYQKMMSEKAA